MANPVIEIYDSTDTNKITSVPFGAVGPGETSDEVTVHVWNNKGGAGAVNDATSCAIAIKTYNLLNTGDTDANGQDLVTNKYIQAKCSSYGHTEFTAIGGTTTLPIGYTTSTAELHGDPATPAEQVATVVLRLVLPASGYTSISNRYKIEIQKVGDDE